MNSYVKCMFSCIQWGRVKEERGKAEGARFASVERGKQGDGELSQLTAGLLFLFVR